MGSNKISISSEVKHLDFMLGIMVVLFSWFLLASYALPSVSSAFAQTLSH